MKENKIKSVIRKDKKAKGRKPSKNMKSVLTKKVIIENGSIKDNNMNISFNDVTFSKETIMKDTTFVKLNDEIFHFISGESEEEIRFISNKGRVVTSFDLNRDWYNEFEEDMYCGTLSDSEIELLKREIEKIVNVSLTPVEIKRTKVKITS